MCLLCLAASITSDLIRLKDRLYMMRAVTHARQSSEDCVATSERSTPR